MGGSSESILRSRRCKPFAALWNDQKSGVFPSLLVFAGKEKTWRMQGANQFRLRKRGACRIENSRITVPEVLVALSQHVEVKAIRRIGEEDL